MVTVIRRGDSWRVVATSEAPILRRVQITVLAAGALTQHRLKALDNDGVAQAFRRAGRFQVADRDQLA
ncbi:hypothetical protein MBOT_34090 [Mycobacterium botniense]|uniref:Uncharacterized protein n=1 Tax=Mycobacterium botniense TaxID=84962 RepID=A0A7I9Y1Y5_9MYCO|nr:hypothetical protein MBOT_34090 [Mycobacterium botniense]